LLAPNLPVFLTLLYKAFTIGIIQTTKMDDPGPASSAFVAGVANKLIFEHDGYEGYEVHLPEFMKNIPGCDPCFTLNETHEDNPRREQIFDEMGRTVDVFQTLPIGFSRLAIAHYVETLVREGFFIKTIMCPCSNCVAERDNDLEPGGIIENEGGYKWLMLSRDVTPLNWQPGDLLQAE
jgi:hypothetical protein